MELIHGGDWAGFEKEYGKAPLDFSANISPLGLPASVKAAAIAALDTAERYPDPKCRALRAALADYHGVGAETIVCGNGAAELIDRICHALRPGRAAVFTPGFSEYARALRAVGCAVTEIGLSDGRDFRLTGEEAAQIPADCGLVFLCNPNNPTGLLTERDTLREILNRCCRARGAVLVVDECFLDFCEDPAAHSLTGALQSYPGLIVLKAFTKTWAMAGLRLGYALCGSRETAEKLQACGQPWAVSNIAQAAGIAAMRERAYLDRLRALVTSERRRMAAALTALGLRVIPGNANFLLVYSGDVFLAEKLRERGILIRDCRNFAGLTAGWYRVAVRTASENDVLLREMEEALG